MEDQQGHKAHRKTKEDRGAKNKKKLEEKKKQLKGNQTNKSHNVANIRRTKRTLQRNLDKEQQKEYVPLTSSKKKSSLIEPPPPPLVVVMGPKGVGKSSLIRSLVKYYTNTNLTETNRGPITVKCDTKARISLLECPSEPLAMLDTAKVADLVLLLVDCKFGFEMEHFEYLNMLQTHGMCKVIGVFTHCDQFKKMGQLRTQKKLLKQRFWQEIYQGAKMFYMSGILHGKYLRNEIKLLAMSIRRSKYRPLIWRNTHPYIVADRIEDVTLQKLDAGEKEDEDNNNEATRKLVLYGYLRGSNLRSKRFHIPGMEDYVASNIQVLSDPLPVLNEHNQDDQEMKHRLKKSLKLYAPHNAHITGEDEEGVYIDLPDKVHDFATNNDDDDDDEDSDDDVEESEGVKMLTSLQKEKSFIDEKLKNVSFQIFKHSDKVTEHQVSESEDSDIEPEVYQKQLNEKNSDLDSDESSDDDGEDDASSLGLNNNKVSQKAAENFFMRKSQNLKDIIYNDDDESDSDDSDSDDDDNFFRLKGSKSKKSAGKTKRDDDEESDEGQDGAKAFTGDVEDLRDKFVTGNWDKENEVEGSDEEVYGDFEDFENPENSVKVSGGGDDSDSAGSEESSDDSDDELDDVQKQRKLNAKKKASATEAEPVDKEEEVEDMENLLEKIKKQKEANLQMLGELDKETVGYVQGQYLKVVVEDIPAGFVENYQKMNPMLLGFLDAAEGQSGFVNTRFRKHRWHKKILKTKDPLIISAGWRRFQSIPYYHTVDTNGRKRYLKYTPEHMHCQATFFSNYIPPNTGVLAIQTLKSIQSFRVVGNGVVLENDSNVNIMKKLKVVGTPAKIYKNTSFITGMFNSSLEVNRFMGAKIRTVSGIRGEIKKSVNEGQPGTFRATFEDKIKLSDIVFLRTWMPVELEQFCVPIKNFIKEDLGLMRSIAQLRIDSQTPIEVNPDSIYNPSAIVRKEVKPGPLKIPKKLEEALPYRSKPKKDKKRRNVSYMTARQRAIVVEPEEKRKMRFMSALYTVKNDKIAKAKVKMQEKRLEKNKKEARLQDKLNVARKALKKRGYREQGKAEARAKKKIRVEE